MKRLFDLQRFATELEKVDGKKIIYLYRLLEDALTDDAQHVAFTTENELSISRDADSTETKDGPIRTPGATEIEITASSILSKGDEMVGKLRDAMINGKTVEIWRVNLAEPQTGDTGKYASTYYHANVTEYTETSSAEDAVEVELTFGVSGTGASGYATVSDNVIEAASYVFKDTAKTGA